MMNFTNCTKSILIGIRDGRAFVFGVAGGIGEFFPSYLVLSFAALVIAIVSMQIPEHDMGVIGLVQNR